MRKWCGTGGFVARGREGCGGVCVTLGADVTVDKEQWVNETARRRPTCLTTPAPGTSSRACPFGCDARRHSIRLEGAGEQRRTGSIVRLYTAADQFTKRHRPQADHGHYLWWCWCCAWCSLPFVAWHLQRRAAPRDFLTTSKVCRAPGGLQTCGFCNDRAYVRLRTYLDSQEDPAHE